MYEGKHIAIAGFGEEGKSSLSYFKRNGAKTTVLDENPRAKVPDGVQSRLGESALVDLHDFDLVVRTPPLNPAKLAGAETTSQTRLFFDKCPAPIIGVTGTKGKGTTATLIANILQASGKNVHLVGNIGRPALDVLDEITEHDVAIYELSSFQLWDLGSSPKIAVVLMISEDHLDVHADIEEYVAAKSNITRYQSSEDTVIYHPANPLSRQVASGSKGKKIRYMSPEGAQVVGGDIIIDDQKICSVEDVGLIGVHNLENICAAVTAVWQVTRDITAISSSVKAFKGLEHRLQLVGEVGSVKFYNDSFSTNADAAIAAIKSFEEPKIIILGGSDKGIQYANLAETVADSNVKKAILIGDIRSNLATALSKAGFKDFEICNEKTMADFVSLAYQAATSGDIVLLSPATASFGLFESYKQRGKLFEQAVRQL